MTGLSLETLLSLPGVSSAKQNRERVEIHAVEAEPVVRALLVRDPLLSGLEVSSAGLEEAFLSLTQEHTNNRSDSN
jgi:ABC-2 type transport system ATP-binding protein